MLTSVTVVAENDRIRSVGLDAPPSSGADVVDLRRYTGIPGRIDAHKHMTYYWDQTTGNELLALTPRYRPGSQLV